MPAGAPLPQALKLQLGAAAVLLGALTVLGWALDFGARRVVVEGDMPVAPDDGAMGLEAPAASRVRYSPAFEVTDPTTLEVRVAREAVPGWLRMDVGVVDEKSSEVRELTLASNWAEGEASNTDDLTASARIDRVTPSRYSVRFDPRWEPEGSTRPVDVTVQVLQGGRSPWPFALAALLLVVPPLWSFARWRRGLA